MALSDRVQPDIEAAPWVCDEIKKLEAKLELVSDRAYRNGLQHGYNLGSIGDHDRYLLAMNSYSREIEGAGK